MSPDGSHGYNLYTHGCRCAVCKRAKAEYIRQRRSAARTLANRFTDASGSHYVPDVSHGRFGYEERGCRCIECRSAMAAEQRTRRMRKRAAS